jgi:hypothetical protein
VSAEPALEVPALEIRHGVSVRFPATLHHGPFRRQPVRQGAPSQAQTATDMAAAARQCLDRICA